jgi:hypothetical protein
LFTLSCSPGRSIDNQNYGSVGIYQGFSSRCVARAEPAHSVSDSDRPGHSADNN